VAEIVPRHVWCPVRGGMAGQIATPTPRLWLHHGATGTSDVKTACSYVAYHIRHHGWLDVGYSFLVADGRVLEGRGPGRAGAHTHGDNHGSHGICMVGSYENRLPSDADLDALVWLVKHGQERGWWQGPITGGHRDAPGASTSCPGTRLWRHIPDINKRVLEQGDVMTPAQEAKLDEVLARLSDRDTRGYLAREVEVMKQAVGRLDVAVPALAKQVADRVIADLPAGTVSAKHVATVVADVLAERLKS
jgi:hypothetical protein